jgi:LysR family transcriptional regulator, mexEF-oprN operon transcriptional activator
LNVVSASSEFMSVLAVAASAPVIATVPTRMAQRYGPRFGLALSPTPLQLRLPAAAMIWSAQLDRDPASSWLRKQLVDLLLVPCASVSSPAAACHSAIVQSTRG